MREQNHAACILEARWRGYSVRKSTENGTGLTAVIVMGKVMSSEVMVCQTPPAMLAGDVVMLVSPCPTNFEMMSPACQHVANGQICTETSFRYCSTLQIQSVKLLDGHTTDKLLIQTSGLENWFASTLAAVVRFRLLTRKQSISNPGEPNELGVTVPAKVVDQSVLQCTCPTGPGFEPLTKVSEF